MSGSRRLFRLLLLVYPRHIRRTHGEDMWLTLQEHLRDARAQGPLQVIGLWGREFLAAWRNRSVATRRRKQGKRQSWVSSWLDSSSLDVKLGFRMLIKHPGLTVVSVFAMSIGMAIGGGGFEFVHDLLDPTIPVEDGDRLVGLWNWDREAQNPEPQSLHDLLAWRQELTAIEHLGAASFIGSNLITADGRAEPVRGAAISPSAFELLNTPPLLGRPLVANDARAVAEPVVVIGYELWQARFGGDSSVIGRTVQLRSASPTIVGVMPEQFAFPFHHNLWVPLNLNVSDIERGEGPRLDVIFGRLASGATLTEAQTQLTAIGVRTAADFPETNQHLQPNVAKYAASLILRQNDPDVMVAFHALQTALLAVLIVACVNVATLVFARTATREQEIVVRSALGASRWRIVRQLFAEALVLAAVAGIFSILVMSWGIDWGISIIAAEHGPLPFWWDSSLSSPTLIFIGALVLLSAAVCGIPPALKTTGKHVRLRLQDANASALRFGILSTGLIVIQVAASVSLLTFAFGSARHFLRVQTFDLPIATQEYLSARLLMDESDERQPGDRYTASFQEIFRRLAAEPGVLAVTYADWLPAHNHTYRRIRIEGGRPSNDRGHLVCVARVDPEFFEALNVPVMAGRSFTRGDTEATRNVVVVNESLSKNLFGDASPIGRTIRYSQVPDNQEEEYEIIGVVPNLGMNPEIFDQQGLYHPTDPGEAYPVHIVAHVAGDPLALAQRLQELTPTVDPQIQVHDLKTLDQVVDGARAVSAFVLVASSAVSLMVLMLTATGTYALMSFTVTRRTREIGIRVALGARSQRILSAIFRRAMMQLGLGVVAGASITLLWFFDDGTIEEFVAICALMMVVGLVACAVPARRALRVQPTEALRDAG